MRLQDETNVLTKKQKLMGLKSKGKPANDDTILKDLDDIKTVLMIGTVESSLFTFDPTNVDVEGDMDLEDDTLEVDPKDREENHLKIMNRVKSVCHRSLGL